MAVLPEFQNQGVGSELVRAGLEACRAIQQPVVFVLGHPGFYRRFGFQPAERMGLRYRDSALTGAFMVVELVPDARAGRTGEVEYLPEFDDL